MGAENLELYKKMYLKLFNKVTDALQMLNRDETEKAKELLMQAQCECEEIYIG